MRRTFLTFITIGCFIGALFTTQQVVAGGIAYNAASDFSLQTIPTREALPTATPRRPLPFNPPDATTTPTPEWLTHLNTLRANAGLPALEENVAWGAANILHARYMVKNDTLTHDETPGNAWYTAEGAHAAGLSNLWISGRTELTPTAILDQWLVAPFHGVALLDPQLEMVGYGEYREEDGGIQFGAGINVQQGITTTAPATGSYPIYFPDDGATTTLTALNYEEFPNPLSHCPGYKAPVGAPIYLQLGAGDLRPETGAHTLTINGKLVAHCLFDETNYRNSDPYEEAVGRVILDLRDAVVILPLKPFPPGAAVSVAIASNETVHKWQFTVAESAPDYRTPTPTPTASP